MCVCVHSVSAYVFGHAWVCACMLVVPWAALEAPLGVLCVCCICMWVPCASIRSEADPAQQQQGTARHSGRRSHVARSSPGAGKRSGPPCQPVLLLVSQHRLGPLLRPSQDPVRRHCFEIMKVVLCLSVPHCTCKLRQVLSAEPVLPAAAATLEGL